MHFFLPFLLALFLPDGAVSSADLCEKWLPAKGGPKAVIVVTHGMNMQPSCMDALAVQLANRGFEVYRPAFSGHCHGDYLKVNAKEWEKDARRIHEAASRRASELQRPLYLLAYSFSSVIFQTMGRELPFEKRLYLAPPFATKFWYPAVRWLAEKFPDFSYSSMNPHCAANQRSSGRSLLALEEFLKRWRSGMGKGDPAPLLAFAEPSDELVDFEGLKAEFQDRSDWRLEPIFNEGHTLPKTYHHLIIDEPSLGKKEWDRLLDEVGKFFSP